jgi:hypothetical protein
MSPFKFLAFTAFLLLAIVGGLAGIVLERRRAAAPALWRDGAVRDALMPVAGWGSLIVLDFAVTLAGGTALPVGFRHLLGTFAVVLLYYAVLSTLRLIYRSLRRIHAGIRSGARPYRPRPVPVLGRLKFPTLFVSALLATLSVLWFDGLTQNFAFIAGVLVLLAMIPAWRRAEPHPAGE